MSRIRTLKAHPQTSTLFERCVYQAWFASRERWLSGLFAGLFVLLFLIHFVAIWKYAVNIPYADEWVMVFRTWEPAPFSFRWLVTPHNEHQIFTTHAFIAIQYYLNGWNHRTNVILNFGIYGITLAWLIMLVRRLAPTMPVWIVFAFTAFLLSPINWMNHFIGLQVCFHFWLLFFLIAVYVLFSSRQSWPEMCAGALALVLSLCSLATGLASGLVVLLVFSLFKISRIKIATNRQERLREILQLVFVTCVMTGALLMWFRLYQISPNRGVLTWPNQRGFWTVYLNLVAFGFGIDGLSTWLGAFCLVIVIAAFILRAIRQRGKLSAGQWSTYAAVAGILGTLAFVAIGRTYLGVEWSKVSRYAEIGMPLIVLSALNWREALRMTKKARAAAMILLWTFCLITFWENLSSNRYRRLAAAENAGRNCVRAYYEKKGDGRCTQLTRSFTATFLERARQLDVSFYREIKAEIEAERTSK